MCALTESGGSPAGFRLRSRSCLFTYNSLTLAEGTWGDFLAWLDTLEFLVQWTATLETSTRSADAGRLHLHVFMEFTRAVDWSTLCAVSFRGICPNAQPTQGRGAKTREVMNHGHFYVFAQKAVKHAVMSLKNLRVFQQELSYKLQVAFQQEGLVSTDILEHLDEETMHMLEDDGHSGSALSPEFCAKMEQMAARPSCISLLHRQRVMK